MFAGWLVEQALEAFSPPSDGTLYLAVDSTLKGMRTHKNPWAKPRRRNEHELYTTLGFGPSETGMGVRKARSCGSGRSIREVTASMISIGDKSLDLN